MHLVTCPYNTGISFKILVTGLRFLHEFLQYAVPILCVFFKITLFLDFAITTPNAFTFPLKGSAFVVFSLLLPDC